MRHLGGWIVTAERSGAGVLCIILHERLQLSWELSAIMSLSLVKASGPGLSDVSDLLEEALPWATHQNSSGQLGPVQTQ